MIRVLTHKFLIHNRFPNWQLWYLCTMYLWNMDSQLYNIWGLSCQTIWVTKLTFSEHLMKLIDYILCTVCWSYNFLAVVYLDADTIVVQSIEDLFKCGKFCANLKHSERLNSGVMVVEPSKAVFNDMMSKVTTLESYTGGIWAF